MKRDTSGVVAVALLLVAGCSGASPAPPPPCDQKCADGTAIRGLRLAVKNGFNRTLYGNDAGTQDESTPCLGKGSARVRGTVFSNAAVGTMDVDLTYDLEGCLFTVAADVTPNHNFTLTMTGTLTEKGTLSAQPTSATSLIFHSPAMTIVGTVYDAPVSYDQHDCVLDFVQDGNNVSGTACGRPAGFTF